MGKMNAIISVTVSAMFLFSSAIAMAGSPYNFTLPPPGAIGTPHVATPSLRQRPVINPSLGHAQRSAGSVRKYIAMTKSKARRQGTVSAGGASWNCTGNRCTASTTWVRPTVQACKALAGAVGAIKSFSKRGAGLDAGKIRSCNAGIVTVRVNRKTRTTFNRGLAARAPVFAPRLSARGVTGLPRTPPAVHAPPVRGGFTPRATSRLAPNTRLPGNGGFAPALRVPPATRNLHKLTRKRSGNRAGGGFAPRTGGGAVPGFRVPGGSRTDTSGQALEMTGKAGAAGGVRTVTSAQALEMTGKTGAGAVGGVRTVTSAQALEMTGLGAESTGAGGGRTVTSAQALEMTGLGAESTGAGGGRTATSAQALEMTGLGAESTGAGGGRTVTSAQALEMTGR